MEMFPNYTQSKQVPPLPFPGKTCRHCEHCRRAVDEYIADGVRYVCEIKPGKNKWGMQYTKLKNSACDFFEADLKIKRVPKVIGGLAP